MPKSLTVVEITLESVERRTFAIACGWPGWARSGKEEVSAIQALCSYGPRYAAVLHSTPYAFTPPDDPQEFRVVERLEGNSTTAFGAPAVPIQADNAPVPEPELQRFRALLNASWQAFDRALAASEGTELKKGPRGGGRDQSKMLEHVIMADESYLGKLGWAFKANAAEQASFSLARQRQAILDGLAASIRGEIPSTGPRGGARWTPRFFVRRVIWHILDHAWEIEDRMR